MVEFGPHGAVVESDGTVPERDYAVPDKKPKIRRVLLACFLCGICASISVALIAALTAFVFSSATSMLGMAPAEFGERSDFMSGAFMAVMMAGFNWIVFYIVIPVTWVILFLSIGLFPRRGILRHAPYYRWGAIWGAVLVAAPTGILGISAESQDAFMGALLTGLAIGCAAGLLCASLFLAIVRPQRQLGKLATDVF